MLWRSGFKFVCDNVTHWLLIRQAVLEFCAPHTYKFRNSYCKFFVTPFHPDVGSSKLLQNAVLQTRISFEIPMETSVVTPINPGVASSMFQNAVVHPPMPLQFPVENLFVTPLHHNFGSRILYKNAVLHPHLRLQVPVISSDVTPLQLSVGSSLLFQNVVLHPLTRFEDRW